MASALGSSRSCSDSVADSGRRSESGSPRASASKSGSASAIALTFRARAASEAERRGAGAPAASDQSNAATVRSVRRGAITSATASRSRLVVTEAERAHRGHVVAGQQHRSLVGRALRRRFEQAGGEAAFVGRQRVARRHAAGADGPVAHRRVVHRVVELDRRQQLRIARERAAHVVVDAEVAVRRGEHAGQVGGVAARAGDRGGRDLERQRHRVGRAAPLGRRQHLRRRAAWPADRPARLRRGRRRVRRPSRAASAPRRPGLRCRGSAACMRSCCAPLPNTSEQLLPPKPKELHSA